MSGRSARRSAICSRRPCGSWRTRRRSPTMPAPARPTTCTSSGWSRPHIRPERHQPEQVHVIGRAGAGIVGLRQRVLHEPHRRLLQMAERLAERLDIGLHRVVGAVLLDEALHLGEERLQRAAAVLAAACGRPDRAPGCRWRPRRSWRCAHRARTAPCRARRCSRGRRTSAAPVTVLAKPVSVSTPLITGVSRPMWSSAAWRSFVVLRAMRDVGRQRGPDHQRARRLVEGADASAACGARPDAR